MSEEDRERETQDETGRPNLWWDDDGRPHWGGKLVDCAPHPRKVLHLLSRGPTTEKQIAEELRSSVHNNSEAIRSAILNNVRLNITSLRKALWKAEARWTKKPLHLIVFDKITRQYFLALQPNRIHKPSGIRKSHRSRAMADKTSG